MRIKQQINHWTIQKVCQLHNDIFHSIHLFLFTTLPILLYHLSCVIKNNKLWDEKKKIFFVYKTISTYHVISKEVENRIFKHTCTFRHTYMCKKPRLTKWWNYYIFVFIILVELKYYIIISDRLIGSWMCFSFYSLLYYQSFMRNQNGKIELEKKVQR